MTTHAAARQRQRRVKRALAGGGATAQLHHVPGHNQNVWEYLRGNRLSNTVFDGYSDIVDTCCDAWNFFIDDPAMVVSTTSRDWAKVSL